MAGWRCPDRDLIEWDGDIKAKKFRGDGSLLTGVGISSETDPIFLAASAALLRRGLVDNVSELVNDAGYITSAGAETDPTFQATSAAYNSHLVSGAIHFTSGAIWDTLNATSNALVTLSGANSTFHNSLSGAYYAHAGDSSDPHGATLTQTNLILTSGAVTGDWSVSGAAYIPNIVYNTTSAAIVASNYPIGSLLVVYTA